MSGIGCRGSICRCQRYAPRSYSKSGLTHTVTHTRKRADKNNGEDRAYLPQYTERKASKSLKKQQAECPDTLRNQQVMCSSHTTSSKKHRKLRFSVLFCCKNAENGVGQNVGQLPDPHPDPHWLAVSGFAAYCQLMPHGYNEMCGKSRRAPERKLLLSLRYFGAFTAYMTCAMKLPMVCAASSCFCLVAWV